jgi:hypothetical protein
MMVMAVSAYCIIFGTDMAIRGQEGSVSRAVTYLHEERKFVIRLFWTAVVLTSLTGMSLAVAKFQPRVRIAVVATFSVFAVVIFAYIRNRVREHFVFPEGHRPGEFLISGTFDPEQGRRRAPGAASR